MAALMIRMRSASEALASDLNHPCDLAVALYHDLKRDRDLARAADRARDGIRGLALADARAFAAKLALTSVLTVTSSAPSLKLVLAPSPKPAPAAAPSPWTISGIAPSRSPRNSPASPLLPTISTASAIPPVPSLRILAAPTPWAVPVSSPTTSTGLLSTPERWQTTSAPSL